MKIKAQGLLNAGHAIENRFGKHALERVLAACRPEVRATYASAIAINWHPASELTELIAVAARELGVDARRLARDLGQDAARVNLQGAFLRVAFFVGKPDYLMRRIVAMWDRYNDQGTMALLEMTDHLARIEVRGIETPDALFCEVILGWCLEVTTALGVNHPTATHVECRARGGARCVYEIRGSA